ncbi:hypothetical protein HMPREF2742_08660 [Enterococcus sp. HMSC072H05]|nr:hypothetical protein HMPREF2742_08660 [Enterococcus sp. HMSC072H05]
MYAPYNKLHSTCKNNHTKLLFVTFEIARKRKYKVFFNAFPNQKIWFKEPLEMWYDSSVAGDPVTG